MNKTFIWQQFVRAWDFAVPKLRRKIFLFSDFERCAFCFAALRGRKEPRKMFLFFLLFSGGNN
jgi:hypothetical protein